MSKAENKAGTDRSNANRGGKAKLNMRATLIMFALIPLISASLAIGIVTITKSSSEIKSTTHDSFVQVISGIGTSFDSIVNKNQEELKGFANAPILKEALLNPEDPELLAAAQQYTLDYFGSLSGWEGLYLADWNSQVMTHPNEPAIGMVLREGDKLTALQNSILGAPEGVFNTGIMTSPASGNIIMSVYAPVMLEGEPIGFVGGGFYVQNIAESIADVSGMNLSTAYTYFVDPQGTMLYHPDESKIGNPVENDAVKSLVAQLEAGNKPDPSVLEYKYKGANKYAAFYIGNNSYYIAVLTADEKDVLSAVSHIRTLTILICIIAVAVFTVLALLVERVISVPLVRISKSLDVLSTGDVTVECDTSSHIRETLTILNSFYTLRDALRGSMQTVRDAASKLDRSIISVDDKTGNNVESISQINTAVNEVAETSQSVAMNAQNMAEKAVDLGESIEQLNTNVENLFEESQTIKNINGETTNRMKLVYEGANESVKAMEEINSKIGETNLAIENIGSAVQAIESIAAQTNLLSLNASIEAARAGEAGRGFAVVADEIRSLADSSAESAKEIKQIIENIITLSKGTVEISNRVFEVITKEQSDIESAQEEFNSLSDSVEASMNEIETIRQMAGTLDRIKTELTNATSDLGAISEELGASAEEVAASSQTVTQACEDTQESTAEMRSINGDMNEAISFFRLD